MIEILRWFLGWSEFKIEGDLNEFLTTYKKNLWLVEKKKNFVLARCMTKDYYSLQKSGRSYGAVLTKIKDHGFLNFLKRYKFRFGLGVGALVFLLAILISNFFVWDIEVVGNALVTDEEIFKVCDENGLHFGSNVFSIDEQDIEHKIKEEHPEISWISLNRIAGKYIIEVSESKKKPDIVDWQGPCNVISTYDGEITYVEAYSGTPLVEAGDKVQQGDILVTGVQEKKDFDNVIYTPSDAKILAKVERVNKISLRKNSYVEQKTGLKKTEKRLSLFGLKIPLKVNKKDDKAVKTSDIYKPLEFFGLRFPILMQTSLYDVYEKIKLKDDDIEGMKRYLLEQQKEWELKELMGNKILNRKYEFEEKKDKVILTAYVNVEQRIDSKAPIEVEEDKEEENFLNDDE